MRFFTIAALLATASAQDNIFANEETQDPHWVSQNKKALQIECGRIKIRLTQAYQYARVVTGLTDDQKGVTSIQGANGAINTCSYDNIAYKCADTDKETFFLKLKFAREALGNVARMNTDENLEYAYNAVFWAYEYGLRCINPTAYYETLVDVTMSPEAQTDVKGKVGALKQTVGEHKTHPQVQAIKGALDKLEATPEFQNMEKQGEALKQTAAFNQTHAKVDKTVADIKASVEGIPNGFHVDNAKIPALRKEKWQTKKAVRQFVHSDDAKAFRQSVRATLKTDAAANVKKAIRAYKKGDGQELRKQMHAIKMTLKKNVKVTDKPAHPKGHRNFHHKK